MRTTTIPSPVGPLTLVGSEAGLRAVLWLTDKPTRVPLPRDMDDGADDPLLGSAAEQLTEYFDGERTTFDVALDLQGTPFQVAVWHELVKIPYGETVGYGQLAGRLGDPGKARAVGAAVGRNPVSIIVPCHRVVGADGSLTGFAGGLEAKRLLLDLEHKVAWSPARE